MQDRFVAVVSTELNIPAPQVSATAALLDDGGTLGSTIAGLTGYRAMPSLAAVILMGLYWLAVWAWLRPKTEARLEASPA